MLKKYWQFIKEDIDEIIKLHHSLGEWVEGLCENNREILELVRPYITDTNPSVRIANAINVLESSDRNSIYKIINNYLNNVNKEPTIGASVDMTNESENTELNAGKNVFNSFLKVITSLGLKDIRPNWDSIPDSFLLFFQYKCEFASVSEKIERFPSLNMFKEKIPKENCRLYFGIKTDLIFSFGFMQNEEGNDDKIIPIGTFKMNKAAIRYLQLIESASAAHLKRELAYLNPENLAMICKIAKHIKQYHPGDTEKRSFKINDGILEFGYKGLGKWESGKMDEEELQKIKKGFVAHLCKINIHDKLLAAIRNGTESWVTFSVKLK
jgi:hypothetical protein